nr:MAG TPA: hypothetical protein [Caudoviricetes sp.]
MKSLVTKRRTERQAVFLYTKYILKILKGKR